MLNKLKEEHRIIIASLLIGIIAITICSKSSFLYPFNDWGDSNCFFTVGKSIVHGIVPYKDLYEQKGPLLYLLHAIAYLISNRSFFGVYILEGICASIVTFFGYKLICLYVKKNQFFLTALSISLIYTSKCFSHGDSAEEFCLPIVIYCMYISIKSLKGDKVLGNKDFLTVGILSGCVFWIKFTLVGFFIGWFIIIAIQIIKKDNLKSLIIKIGFIILGVLIATIPYIVYFGLHNALSDWINVYIINNIFSYSKTNSTSISLIAKIIKLFNNVLFALIKAFKKDYIFFIIILTGVFTSLFYMKIKEFLHYLFMLLFTIVFVYIGGRGYTYYAFIFSGFLFFGMISMGILLEKLRLLDINILTVPLVLSLTLLLSPNVYFMKYSKQDLPQYKFDKIISRYNHPTLLNYGFLDGGFYTVSHILPSQKYFCELNIPLKDMYQDQNDSVKNGDTDFVVTRNEKINSKKYKLIDQADFVFEKKKYTYYQYQNVN